MAGLAASGSFKEVSMPAGHMLRFPSLTPMQLHPTVRESCSLIRRIPTRAWIWL